MQISIPAALLVILENWFCKCFSCVRWNTVYSNWFKLRCGVRQGGVLSPYLFALYVETIIDKIKSQRIGCMLRSFCLSIILYADDMLLLAPSVEALQQLVLICECELKELDLSINIKKSFCVRIGSRHEVICGEIITSCGHLLLWVDKVRYLGIFIVRFRYFKCCFDHAKQTLYRSFNSIFGKVGRVASEEVILSLLKAKCLPCMLYGIDACPVNKTESRSLDFPVTRILMKLFKTSSNDVIKDCQCYFNFPPVHDLIRARKIKFLNNLVTCDVVLCRLFEHFANKELHEIYLTN